MKQEDCPPEVAFLWIHPRRGWTGKPGATPPEMEPESEPDPARVEPAEQECDPFRVGGPMTLCTGSAAPGFLL